MGAIYNGGLSFLDWAQNGSFNTTMWNDVETDEFSENISCFCFSQDGLTSVLATEKYNLVYCQLESKTIIRKIKGSNYYQMPIICIEFDHSGLYVATGSADRTVRVWDIVGGFCTHSFRGHQDIVNFVRFTDDMLVISGSDDKTIQVHSMDNNSRVGCFTGHFATPTAVEYLHCPHTGNRVLLSCGRDKVIQVINMTSRALVQTVLAGEDELESLVLIPPEDTPTPTQPAGQRRPQQQVVYTCIAGGTGGVLRVYQLRMGG